MGACMQKGKGAAAAAATAAAAAAAAATAAATAPAPSDAQGVVDPPRRVLYIVVTKGDLDRLDGTEFLNDTLIDFYLKCVLWLSGG